MLCSSSTPHVFNSCDGVGKIRGIFHGLKKLDLKNLMSLITPANKKYSNA
jgi:hypothetical protein